MLKISKVSKSFVKDGKRIEVIKDFDAEFHDGQFIVINGPSGSGKTTLLLMLGTLLSPDSGEIFLDGEDIVKADMRRREVLRSENIGFVFQQFHLLPYFTVLDNILACELPGGQENLRDEAKRLIVNFGLSHRINHYPSELSSGEKQRTALIRAIVKKPKLLLADEPLGNLDAENAKIILDAFKNFAGTGRTVVMVTHESQALDYADRVLKLALK